MKRYGPFRDEAEARRLIDEDGRGGAWLAARGAVVIFMKHGVFVDLPEREPYRAAGQ
jgi:hypothetical protein